MKILSLDTSTTSTGWAVFDDNKLVKYDLINYKKIKDTSDRLGMMIGSIFDLIDKENPSIVVTEMTVVTRNAQAQRNLTMILGAIYGKCLLKKIEYASLRPTEWRSLISKDKKPRKREELKQWSLDKVEELFGINGIVDDVSDGILIGWAWIKEAS